MSSVSATMEGRRQAWFILAFCGVYLAVQVGLIARGHFTASKHFAFWMFPESTYFIASLSRVLADGREVNTSRGSWAVRTESGKVEYHWSSFVHSYRMDRMDRWQRSKGIFDDTLKYFQAALDYVAERIPEDKFTDQLVLTIRYERAGGPQRVIVLESRPRLGGRRDGAN